METTEKIEVYIDCRKGKTVCICKAGKKKCTRPCEKAIVERDRFEDWEKIMRQDRYGHCKGIE